MNPWIPPLWTVWGLGAGANIGMWMTISSPAWPVFTGIFVGLMVLWIICAVGAWRYDR